MPYGVWYEFGAQGDPPRVLVAEEDGRGTQVVEVLEAPRYVGDARATFGWGREDWAPGPLAKRVVGLLNKDELGDTPALRPGMCGIPFHALDCICGGDGGAR